MGGEKWGFEPEEGKKMGRQKDGDLSRSRNRLKPGLQYGSPEADIKKPGSVLKGALPGRLVRR
jgi:hypothetical protein